MGNKIPFGLQVTPYGWPLMAGAFISFVHYAILDESFQRDFHEDTGLNIMSVIPKSTMGGLVDEATGYTHDILSRFMEWLTINHWGVENEYDGQAGLTKGG